MRVEKKRNIRITSVGSNFVREPLIRPFGFKGGFLTELWQGISCLQSDRENMVIGLSTQSTLWSDPDIFLSHSEAGGNSLMFSISEYAIQLMKDQCFNDPIDLQDKILGRVIRYGKKITNNPQLRETFILNALVGLDLAVWKLYATENNIQSFDDLIPAEYRIALSHRQNKVANIPLISYNTPINEVKGLVESGHFFLKIKLGHPGSQADMLEKDQNMLKRIHKTIGNKANAYTFLGKPLYYFDANGRYKKKETLLKFLHYAEKIGVRDQIAMMEEPFPEDYKIDVSDIPVRMATDESAHTAKNVEERIQMGYRAIALKPIAKTLSMTLKMIKVAFEKQIPCFCADLTVNPILVDWNKNIAARLSPFPGLSVGLIESNGSQNYKNWEKMKSYHPCQEGDWLNTEKGFFNLSNEFYKESGGVLRNSTYYMDKINL